MNRLILINGCGGAGKDTSGRLLLEELPRSALIDIKALSMTNPWEYSDFQLGLRNAAAIIKNFFEEGFDHVIFSGGLNSQDRVDYFFEQSLPDLQTFYCWLDVPKETRDRRRIGRNRDKGDGAQYLDKIDEVFTDPGGLALLNGKFHRFEVGTLTPTEVISKIKDTLSLG
jgi:hypothetical protein